MTHESIIETRTCRHCGTSFPITDKDLEFYEKVSPIFNGIRYDIPPPKLCPDCRQQRRLSFRNERHLYKRNCDATGKEIISIYSPDKPYKVYNQSDWWSDRWNANDYGRDFDFSRTFFEQFNDLKIQVPRLNLINISSENSDYCALSAFNKDCYLIVGNSNESCLYGIYLKDSKNVEDSYFSLGSENCFEIIDSNYCNKVIYGQNLEHCTSSYFLFNCKNCNNCFCCVGLTNQEYCIFNKQYSKEEYEKSIKDNFSGNYENHIKYKKLFSDFKMKFPVLNLRMNGCVNTIGDNVGNANNCHSIFDSNGIEGTIEDCKYISLTTQIKDCHDIDDSGMGSELCYEGNTVAKYRILFSNGVLEESDIYYSDQCYSSSHLFGCVGLRNSKYCILNKQYTRDEYETLVPKIIEHMKTTGEWGEFFPSSISPFGYNETVAMEYYPIERRDAINRVSTDGKAIFKWSLYEPPFPKVEKTIPASKLPENIQDIPDDILNWAIECEITNKPYRIIRQELDFYRKHNLPIPRRHPDQRHLDRMKLRNPRKLYNKLCMKCGIDMKTTYSPERTEIVYCEECYNMEAII